MHHERGEAVGALPGGGVAAEAIIAGAKIPANASNPGGAPDTAKDTVHPTKPRKQKRKHRTKDVRGSRGSHKRGKSTSNPTQPACTCRNSTGSLTRWIRMSLAVAIVCTAVAGYLMEWRWPTGASQPRHASPLRDRGELFMLWKPDYGRTSNRRFGLLGALGVAYVTQRTLVVPSFITTELQVELDLPALAHAGVQAMREEDFMDIVAESTSRGQVSASDVAISQVRHATEPCAIMRAHGLVWRAHGHL